MGNIPRCFPSYAPVERKKDNEIIDADCAKLEGLIAELDRAILTAAHKAYAACMFKNSSDIEACVNCDKIVVQEKNHTGRTGRNLARMNDLFDGKHAKEICNSRYTTDQPCIPPSR